MESTLIPFIPSNLLPLLQTDLLVLEQARKKNAAQHRSALFFRRVHEVYRLGKEIYRELGWTNEWLSEERERRKAEAFRIHHELKEEGHEQIQRLADGDAIEHIDRLTKLLEKIFPALTKASDSVSKMIHHLHFMPLTTLLQACYARVWVISTTIYAHVRPRPGGQGASTMVAAVGYDDAVRFAHPSGMTSPNSLSNGSLDAARAELEERNRSQGLLGKGKSISDFGTPGYRDMESAQTELVGVTDGEGKAEMIDFGTKIERNDIEGHQKMTSAIEKRIRKKTPVTSFSQPGSGTSTPVGDHVVSDVITPEVSRSPSRDVERRAGKAVPDVVAEPAQPSKPGKKKRKSDMDDLFGSLEPKKSSLDDLQEVKSEKKRKLAGQGRTEIGSSSSREGARPASNKAKADQETAKPKLKRKKKKADDIDDIFGF